MNDKEKIKVSLASVLFLLMDNSEPGENNNIDKLIFSICDFLNEEYGMTKDEIRELINGITIQFIGKTKDKILN